MLGALVLVCSAQAMAGDVGRSETRGEPRRVVTKPAPPVGREPPTLPGFAARLGLSKEGK